MPGALAGAEKVVIGGAAAQRAEGDDVEVWLGRELRAPQGAADVDAALDASGVPRFMFDVRGRLDARAVHELRRRVAAERPDVLHLHGYKATVYALAAGGRAARVATHHGETSHDARVRWYARAMFAAYRHVDRVVAVSDATRDRLVDVGVEPARIDVVENFASLGGVVARANAAAGDVVHAVSVGRLSAEKGLDVLAKALADPALRGRMRWTAYGAGDELESLRALAQTGAVDATFAGFVDDVGAALADADLFVMPSLREGMPMALLEALATGLPVVASAVGSMPALVDTSAGALVPAGDVQALRSALVDALDALPRWRAAARERAPQIAERFSVTRWAAETRAVYHRALRG